MSASERHVLEMSDVTVKCVPANATAHQQHMDGGIIRNVKGFYRSQESQLFLRCMEDDKPPTVDLKQAITMSSDSWREVTATAIANCWRHVGILPQQEQADLKGLATETHTIDDSVLHDISEARHQPGLEHTTARPTAHSLH